MKVALQLLWVGVLQVAMQADAASAANGAPLMVGAQATGTRLPDAVTSGEIEPLFATPTRLDRAGRIVAPVYINGQGRSGSLSIRAPVIRRSLRSLLRNSGCSRLQMSASSSMA